MGKKIKYKDYVHKSKDSNWEKARELGLDDDEKFMYNFIGSLYEVELDMEVDVETGESRILKVDGRELMET